MLRLVICPLELGDLLRGSQAVKDGADQRARFRGIGVPGKAGCVALWEMLVPSQPDWLLEMGSDGVK